MVGLSKLSGKMWPTPPSTLESRPRAYHCTQLCMGSSPEHSFNWARFSSGLFLAAANVVLTHAVTTWDLLIHVYRPGRLQIPTCLGYYLGSWKCVPVRVET